METNNNATTFDDAFSRLAEGLVTHQAIKVGSFWEFLRDIWSLSYDNPDYFNAWHVGVLAEDLTTVLYYHDSILNQLSLDMLSQSGDS